MVEQGGELQLLVRLCCLPHTRQPLGHASPALRREHVELSSVLLDQRPSLPTLRKLAIVFVRMVHRYYAAVRLLRERSHQPHGLGLRWPSCCPSGSAGIAEVSRFSCMKFPDVLWVLRLRGTAPGLALASWFILPSTFPIVSASRLLVFEAQ